MHLILWEALTGGKILISVISDPTQKDWLSRIDAHANRVAKSGRHCV